MQPRLVPTLVAALSITVTASAQAVLLQFDGSQAGKQVGLRCGAAGDTDGDGFGDVIFSLHRNATDPISATFVAQSRTGQIRLLFSDKELLFPLGDRGATQAIVGAWQQFPNYLNSVLVSTADGSASSSQLQFGSAESGGDFDADGMDNFVGMDQPWNTVLGFPGFSWTYPAQPRSAHGVGDTNGDGFDDVLVIAEWGCPWNPSEPIPVFAGSPSWSTPASLLLELPPIFGCFVEANDAAEVGDVDSDGRDDFVLALGNTGVAVYSGVDGALIRLISRPGGATNFGQDVTYVGDSSGDGVPDIAVSAVSNTTNGPASGSAWLFSGADGSLLTAIHGQPGDRLGASMAGLGDFNGDGLGDVVVGAPGHLSGTLPNAGRIIVFTAAVSPPKTFCTPKVNSQNCTPYVWASGSPSLSGSDQLVVHAARVINNSLGVMFWGRSPSNVPFAGGTLCINSPLVRTTGQNSGGSAGGLDCTGSYSFPFTHAYMQAHQLHVGSTVYCQFWARDPGYPPPANIGLTDGVFFTVSF